MKIFFSPKQTTDKNTSRSPSAGKPALVMKNWIDKKYPIEIVEDFGPVTREDFYKCHDQKYVDSILDLKENNGFGNKIKEVNDTLFYTTGSLVAAAEWAAKYFEKHGIFTIACSPTSGFHHAGYFGYEKFGYFCTFNGLMVAAQRLHKMGLDKVGILDLDHHCGNGTIDIIEKLGIKYIRHYSFGEKFNNETYLSDGRRIPSNYEWGGKHYATEWLKSLQGIVERFEDCDIVLYQASADAHYEDPFGGALTTQQLRERDRIVFENLMRANTPVVWNLAGGYQVPVSKVLEIHEATLQEGLSVLAKVKEVYKNA